MASKSQLDAPEKSLEELAQELNATKPIVQDDNLSRLDSLSRDELIALVRRMSIQCGMVAAMTEDEIRQGFLDKMAHIGLTGDALVALNAMEKRMNRVEGTPMQRQQSMVAVANVESDRVIEIVHVKA